MKSEGKVVIKYENLKTNTQISGENWNNSSINQIAYLCNRTVHQTNNKVVQIKSIINMKNQIYNSFSIQLLLYKIWKKCQNLTGGNTKIQ